MSGQEVAASPLFLGIDLGTSSCKTVLTTSTGRILKRETASYPLTLTPGGGVEQDPDGWWGAVVSTAASVASDNPAIAKKIASIGVTGQWSGTVALGKDGVPLRKAIIWMDTRGEAAVRDLTSGFPGISGYRLDKLIRWVRKTGGAPGHAGKDSLAHILYLKHNEPDVYRNTACFLEPKDYINFRLTGELSASWDNTVVTWVTDNRDASNVRYDTTLLKLATLDPKKLPSLNVSTTVVGKVTEKTAQELGIPTGVKVVAGAGDMQTSLIGSGCTRPNQFHLYVGTSSWLTAHVPYKKTDIFHNMATLPSAIPGMYAIIATQESAGSSLSYVRDLLFGGTAAAPGFDEIDRLASKASPAEGRALFTPWLYGERAPVEDRNLRGALFNLSLGAGRPQVLRSVMEGVAYNTRWMLEPVESLAGHRAEPIRIGGGGANSALWCQIFADVLNRKVEPIEDPVYATAKGAALIAAVGAGSTTFDAIAKAYSPGKIHVPIGSNVKIYDEMFRHFRRFHSMNKALYRDLNMRGPP